MQEWNRDIDAAPNGKWVLGAIPMEEDADMSDGNLVHEVIFFDSGSWTNVFGTVVEPVAWCEMPDLNTLKQKDQAHYQWETDSDVVNLVDCIIETMPAGLRFVGIGVCKEELGEAAFICGDDPFDPSNVVLEADAFRDIAGDIDHRHEAAIMKLTAPFRRGK